MRVLAVDTSSSRGGVALVDGASLRGEVRLDSEAGYSRLLLPAIDFVLESLRLTIGSVEAFAVTTGPGSFTGLRVGIATVQGLALATRRVCLGVPALDVLAARIRGAAAVLVAMIDGYRDDVFAATYDAEARLTSERVLLPPDRFLEDLPASAAFIGDGALRYRDLILARRPQALFPDRSLFLAGSLARLAGTRLAAGEGTAPEDLRPLYIRGADIRLPETH